MPVESGEHIQFCRLYLFGSVITTGNVCHTLRGECLDLVDFDGRVDGGHAQQLELSAISKSLVSSRRRKEPVKIGRSNKDVGARKVAAVNDGVGPVDHLGSTKSVGGFIGEIVVLFRGMSRALKEAISREIVILGFLRPHCFDA